MTSDFRFADAGTAWGGSAWSSIFPGMTALTHSSHFSFRYIKMSSPNMNNLIILGCVLAYTSVFLLGADGGLVPPEYYAILCSVFTPCTNIFISL
jgi:hypothetical protein